MFVKIQSNWNSHTLLLEIHNDAATMKHCSSQTISDKVTTCPRNPIPRYLAQRNENLRSHKNLYTKVCGNISHNYSNGDILLSFLRQMDKTTTQQQ